jgi:hypothetical protein
VESNSDSAIEEKEHKEKKGEEVGGVSIDRKGAEGGERTEIEDKRKEKGENSAKKRRHLPGTSVLKDIIVLRFVTE